MVTAALREAKSKYEPYFPIAFFIGGVLFDILTLQRIDDLITIGQQAFYLVVLLLIMMQMFFEEAKPGPQITPLGIRKYYFKYRVAALHFIFGALFSCFSFFFFKSSSVFTSSIFLLIMVTLLVANEFEHVKNMGLPVKFALFAVCSLSFFASLVPTLIGFVGVTVFLLSMFVGCLPLVLVTLWIQSKHGALFEKCKRQILVPNGLVLILFLSLYMFKIIPPIPLSIPFMGIYHTIERTNDGFRLGHQREWWRIWNNGDQVFKAQKGDKIFVFFQVFSPTNFSDQVLVRWYLKDVRSGWVLQDSIPIKIAGGREEGFRGFGSKSNYQPGDWKVQVETTDGREIGRIYFNLELRPDEPREFVYTIK